VVEDKDRLDRELIELLNELRVALPGVQVLFAFLLILPFTNRFEQISGLERAVYFIALLGTTLASALMIAPSAYHRIRFREHDKEALIVTSNRLLLGGMAALAVAIVCSVFVIADLIYGPTTGVVTAVGTAAIYGWFWYGMPLRREGRG
jgi:phosphatidylserine synthase